MASCLGPCSCSGGCMPPPCSVLELSHTVVWISLAQICEFAFFQDEPHLAISCFHFQLREVLGGDLSVLVTCTKPPCGPPSQKFPLVLFAPALGLWGQDSALALGSTPALGFCLFGLLANNIPEGTWSGC